MDFSILYQELQNTTKMIRALLAGVEPGAARLKPNAQSWSILEVMCHLYDEEREDFRQYLDFILYRRKEEWYAIDPKRLVTELNYNEQDFAEMQENGVGRAASGNWLPAVLHVAQRLAEQAHVALQTGHIPLVIGGDCTIELGTLSGLLSRHTNIALLYFDGGVDLRTPADNPTGMLDSMGVAHMLAAPGAAEALSHIGPRFPLMTDDRVILFGYTPNPQSPEHAAFARYAMPRYTGEQVHDQPEATANRAWTQIEQLAEYFIIHFDVDVIDFKNFPIADVPQINEGLAFQEAMTCLSVFVANPKFMGLTITEFNSDHADENGMFATKFV